MCLGSGNKYLDEHEYDFDVDLNDDLNDGSGFDDVHGHNHDHDDVHADRRIAVLHVLGGAEQRRGQCGDLLGGCPEWSAAGVGRMPLSWSLFDGGDVRLPRSVRPEC